MSLSRRFWLTLAAVLALAVGSGGGWALAQEGGTGGEGGTHATHTEPTGDEHSTSSDSTESETGTASEPAGDDTAVESEGTAAPAPENETRPATFTG